MLRATTGLSARQVGAFSQAVMPSQRWTGPRCFSTANSAIVANTLYGCPFIPTETFTCDQLAARVATGAAGSAKFGIYTALATLLPDALVAEVNADSDTTATATVSAGFTSNPTLNAGQLYYLASCFSVTPTMVCWNNASAQVGGYTWMVGASAAGAILITGGPPTRVTRDAALTYVAASQFFPATFGASTEGSGAPGSPILALRKL